MKRIVQLLTTTLLLLLANPIFAVTNIFTIPSQDLSMNVLNRVFGSIGTLLYGAVGQTAVGNVLQYFNNAALVLGGIVILYSLIVSTINTAHDGEMLGKKWNSVWIPVRAAGGFALLLPTKAGYAVIQVIVMWVVVQGVGAADYLWTNTVTVQQNYTAPATLASTGRRHFSQQTQVAIMSNLGYAALICQGVLASELGAQSQTTDTGSAFQLGVQGVSPADICGSVSYVDSDTNSTSAKGNVESWVNNLKNGPVSSFLANYDLTSPQALTQQQQYTIQTGITSAADAYINAAENQESANAPPSSSGLSSTDLQNLVKGGWMTAGAFYMTLTEAGGNSAYAQVKILVPTMQQGNVSDITNMLGSQNMTPFYNAMKSAMDATCLKQMGTPQCTPVNKQSQVENELKLAMPSGITGWVAFLISPVMYVFSSILLSKFLFILTHTMAYVTGGYTPINDMAQLGVAMLNVIFVLFSISLFLIAIVGMMSYVCSCVNPCGYALSQLISIILPFIMFAVGGIWLFGSIAAYYVPLIPYILFTFGSIAWVVSVIEAMVAAPIVALGIIYPEGQHDIFGSASAGVMLLSSIFLRPGLMIVGFWASYVMVSISVGIINYGFQSAIGYMSRSGAAITLWGLVSFIAIYVTVLTIAIQKAFTLVYEIPDKILRWIGGQGMESGLGQELQEIKGGYEKTVQGVQQAGQQAQSGAQETARAYERQQPQGGGGTNTNV